MISHAISSRSRRAATLVGGMLLALLMTVTFVQAQGIKKGAIQLVNKDGCKLFHAVTDVIVHVQLRNDNDPNCFEKTFNANVLYGYASRAQYSNGTTRDYLAIRAGWMRAGRFVGLQLILQQQDKMLLLLNGNGNAQFVVSKQQSDYRLSKILEVIDSETDKLAASDSEKQDALSNHYWLRDTVMKWDQDPDGMMRRFTSDASRPIQSNPIAMQVDDPKTVGRGVRVQ